ncbi:MAG TPA: methylamine methyltransferase corrinoid protein reductive activase [Methanosarcina thermophila]|jgi:methylamine methyltransferase corrinoid activation protein|uniref:NADH-plastoquinone oxidoreductase subunit n=1 Tax=Methanosarcina thermophila (strain ATCC 43570 / DSM 1825 / OCM 12 / VKM B-1830 / TM-1) TaxID=523844 RepID=A0A0E3NFD8_METTT|nr:methylamine methyltransferase corrinoid protein reductive activase [Methanosarcina thermophila]AKB13688.1 NADH-plastoquinone oxidoreductase subunit [Methanosarcina thermophila TM-1]HOQ66066.1 methylamine methyltransferase corrinoid protein reductive activase [Methanosarcina thermophila]HPT80506.1 methylamine methyltransferase corrinoid protein reductive activase [Methanosarcina thermophila]
MYGIALDLGTSGFRAQLIDLETKETLKTVITMGHPLPGGNVMDHLDFAITTGEDVAHAVILETIRRMFRKFDVDLSKVERLAVCGNPIQLSLFQNMEIRDLAYAGENKQKKLGVQNVKRDARIFPASEIFVEKDLPNCEIIVPPAIKHEIGADALAMMLETDFLIQPEISLVTDYGTNAEMALKIGDRIITASAAAGPAIEGQGISSGMLASPGAICDVKPEGEYWRIMVLDRGMEKKNAYIIHPVTGEIKESFGYEAAGITGTGVISAFALALKSGLMEKPPKLPNGKLILGPGIEITEKDVEEAGKAIGAIRAAHLTMIVESGIKYEDLEYAYMSGASGTYVDAEDARRLGAAPGYAKRIVQFGNTSLALARELVLDKSRLDDIISIARKITANHLMMATSETFNNFYLCELSYWTMGMPLEMYNEMLELYGLPPLPKILEHVSIEKRVSKDIEQVGSGGLTILKEIGIILEVPVEKCIHCKKCVQECPEAALEILEIDNKRVAKYDSQKCLGTSCRRCVAVCPESAIDLTKLKITAK